MGTQHPHHHQLTQYLHQTLQTLQPHAIFTHHTNGDHLIIQQPQNNTTTLHYDQLNIHTHDHLTQQLKTILRIP